MPRPENVTIGNEEPTLTRQQAAEQIRAIITQVPWMDSPEVLADAMSFTLVSILPEGEAQERVIDLHAEQIKSMIRGFYSFMRMQEAKEAGNDEPQGHA